MYRALNPVRLIGATLLAMVAIWCVGSTPGYSAQPAAAVASIEGTVVDRAGRAIPGASVGVLMTQAVRQHQENPSWQVVTDSRGHFNLKIPRALGRVTLVARAAGMAPARSVPIALGGEKRNVGALVLDEGVSVAGRIIDEQRKPIAGARVLATPENVLEDTTPAHLRSQAVSGADGRFQIRGAERAPQTLSVSADGFVPRYLRRQPFGDSSASASLEIVLFPPTYLRGQLFDASAAPVAGAELIALQGRDPEIRGKSDSQGRFELGPFARGSRVELRAYAAGFTPVRTDDVVAPTHDIIVRLNRNGTLRGRVVEAGSKRAVGDFEVRFHAKPPLLSMTSPGGRAFRAADGRFEWPDLMAGAWQVSVHAKGYRPLQLQGLSIPPGRPTPELLFELEKGYAIAGRVTDRATGAAIAGASLTCSQGEPRLTDANDTPLACAARTKADGSFELSGLAAGTVTLTVSAADYSPAVTSARADDDAPLDIALDAGASISGRLVSSDAVTPVAGMVSLEQSQYSVMRPTDAQGAFHFASLAPGTYQLSADAPLGRSKSLSVSVQPGQKVEGVLLALQVGSTIRGTISGLLPGEHERTRVLVRGAADFQRDGELGSNGTFEVSGVPPGAAEVTVGTALDRRMTKQVQVSRATAIVDFAFPPGYRLSGRVMRAGQPARFVKLDARPADGQGVEAEAESTQSGQYAFEGLARGSYVIAVGGSREVRYTVVGDSVLNLELPSLAVAGTVTDVTDGRPLQGVLIELRSAEDASSSIRLSDDSNFQGNFEIAGLEPGEYKLSAYQSGYDLFEQTLDVTTTGNSVNLALVPTAGVTVRVRDAATGTPLDNVMVIEQVGARNGHRLELALDSQGVGRLPPSLAGRELLISWLGYSVTTIDRWDGRPLELALKRNSSEDAQ